MGTITITIEKLYETRDIINMLMMAWSSHESIIMLAPDSIILNESYHG